MIDEHQSVAGPHLDHTQFCPDNKKELKGGSVAWLDH